MAAPTNYTARTLFTVANSAGGGALTFDSSGLDLSSLDPYQGLAVVVRLGTISGGTISRIDILGRESEGTGAYRLLGIADTAGGGATGSIYTIPITYCLAEIAVRFTKSDAAVASTGTTAELYHMTGTPTVVA